LLVVALLSPHSVRLEGERGTPHGASVCHYELMLAARTDKPVLPVVVIDCDTPLAIIRYEPFRFTGWQSSSAAYQERASPRYSTHSSRSAAATSATSSMSTSWRPTISLPN